MRKLFLIVMAGVSVAGLGAWFVGHSGSDQGSSGSRKSGLYVPDEVAANGIVEGVTPVVELRSELIGTISAIQFRENQTVTKGSLLVELNNASQKEQVAVAEAEMSVAEADLQRLLNGERPEKRKVLADTEKGLKAEFDLAEAKWNRAKNAIDKGVGSSDEADAAYFNLQRLRAEYERAKSERALVEAPARADEVVSAKARINAASARLALARAELARTRILAPSNGTILQRFAEPGDMACPTSAQPILVLADLSRLRVRAFIEELDVARVRVGQRAVVTADGLPGEEFKGVVSRVLPRMGRRGIETDAPGEYKDIYHREVLIDLDAGQTLPVSLRVRVRIAAPEDEKASTALPAERPITAAPVARPARQTTSRGRIEPGAECPVAATAGVDDAGARGGSPIGFSRRAWESLAAQPDIGRPRKLQVPERNCHDVQARAA